MFPETFKTARPLVENGAMVVVRGKLERDDETVRVLATEMVGMGTVRERLAREMAITVAVPPHGRETFEALADLFAHHRGDKPVTFQLLVKDQGRQLRVRAQVSAQIRVKPTSALVAGSGEDLRRRGRGAALGHRATEGSATEAQRTQTVFCGESSLVSSVRSVPLWLTDFDLRVLCASVAT